MRTWTCLIAVLALAACSRPPAHSTTPAPPPKEEAAPVEQAGPRLPADIVQRAALPHVGYRTRDQRLLEPSELTADLASADAICVGERHDNPHDHYAQLVVLDELLSTGRMGGRQVAIGFEMVPRPYQRYLNDYAEGDIDEGELWERTEWDENWGFDFNLYRPLFVRARRAGSAMIALNVPRELTQKVARKGLSGLDHEDYAQLPDLDLFDTEHRQWFKGAMKRHPGPHRANDNMYAAQVLWDETMAETAAKHLEKSMPARQLLIVAGNGHCWQRAIPRRLRRRTGARVLAVRPVLTADGQDFTAELEGFDYGLVLSKDLAQLGAAP